MSTLNEDLPSLPHIGEAAMLIAAHREGDLDAELSAAFRRAAEAAEETGKPATVTVKFTFAADDSFLLMSDKVDERIPRHSTARPYRRDLDSGELLAVRMNQPVLAGWDEATDDPDTPTL